MSRCLLASTVMAILPILALAQKPVAFVEDPGQAALLRYGSQHPVALTKGELLFPGDRVSALGTAEPIVWFCPTKETIRASQGASFVVENTRVRLYSGPSLAITSAPYCQLPQSDRSDVYRPRFFSLVPPGTSDPAAATPDQIRAATRPGQEPLLQELQVVESTLQRQAGNTMARITKGSILQQIGLERAAANEYRGAEAQLGRDGVRLKEIVHQTQARLAAAARNSAVIQSPNATGRTIALLVGISKYDRPERELRFADRDALVFYDLLRSPRGGNVPEGQLTLLLNEQATNARVREGIQKALLDNAQPNDTIIFFFSAHGATENGSPYLIPSDGDPDNLHDTGIDMGIIRKLLQVGVAKQCRVLILLDVCRAGAAVGNVTGPDVGLNDESEILIITASRANQSAIEAVQFGGGHSAFSYFVLRGLNGDADEDRNGQIDGTELVNYVRREVPAATGKCQHPVDYPHMTEKFILVPNLGLPGIQIDGWSAPPNCKAAPPGTLAASVFPTGTKSFQSTSPIEEEFLATISPGSDFDETLWFTRLEQLKIALALRPDRYRNYEAELRTVLLDRGQEILLRYLEGEARPQLRADFELGERYFRAALRLDPDAPAILGRMHFCNGRKLIFDKQYAEAIEELERAVRFDPEGPYVFNALGIAYLEQVNLASAATAFREAQRLAPRWLYPRHNLALTLVEDGQFERAREVLQAAMRQSPNLPYLPYSQGILEARVNRMDAAAKSFQKAIQLDPKRASAYDGLAFVQASRGKVADAERRYRQALAIEPESPSIRHNFALLLAGLNRFDEAEALWLAALKTDPDFLPGLAGLAEAYAVRKQWPQVVPLARRLRAIRPDYRPAQLLLARAFLHTDQAKEALAALEGGAESAELLLLRGDALFALERRNEAGLSYRRAQQQQASLTADQRRHVKRRLNDKAER